MDLLDSALRPVLLIGLIIPLFIFWILAFVDLARRKDLAASKKAVWAAAMFFGGYIGIAFYFALRPIPPPAGKDVNATVPRSSAIVSELETLQASHDEGEFSDDNYLTRKRGLFGPT